MTIEFRVSFYNEFINIYKGNDIVGFIKRVHRRGLCVDWIMTPVLDYEELKTIYDKVTELIELDSRPSAVESLPRQPAP